MNNFYFRDLLANARETYRNVLAKIPGTRWHKERLLEDEYYQEYLKRTEKEHKFHINIMEEACKIVNSSKVQEAEESVKIADKERKLALQNHIKTKAEYYKQLIEKEKQESNKSNENN